MLFSTKKKYMFIIYELSNKEGVVRSIDISKALGVKKASVSLMLPNLVEDNMIERTDNGSVVFTEKGAVFAGELYLKYITLYQFFKGILNSSDENARKDAICCLCSLTDENVDSITEYILKNGGGGAA